MDRASFNRQQSEGGKYKYIRPTFQMVFGNGWLYWASIDTNISQIFFTHVSLDVFKWLAVKDNDMKAANTNTNTSDPHFTWYFEVVVLDNNRKVARLGCSSAHTTAPHWMHTLI